MTTPLVSVVVPTHDRSAQVRRAVSSVLGQTVDELEVLVVDDGSVDDTPAVLADLAAADRRVRCLRRDRAGGPPHARNDGIAAAVAPFVAFLDDDDEWLPTKLERQLALLEAEPDVVVAGCHHVEVADDTAGVAHRGPLTCTRQQLLWSNFVGSTSLGVVRRAAFEDGLPRFDVELRACQDWDYWVRCTERGEAVAVPDVLCRYSAGTAPRVTNDRAKRYAGHERFAAVHAGSMSADCRSFLAARLRLMAAPSQARELLLGPRLLATTRPRAAWALANEILGARTGAKVGDPARGARRLHAVIGDEP